MPTTMSSLRAPESSFVDGLTLPLEILDHIFTLSDDSTLLKSGLLSRYFAYSQSGRQLIFELINFEGHDGVDRYNVFLNLLSSPIETFSASIKAIYFTYIQSQASGGFVNTLCAGTTPARRTQLKYLADKLRNVESIGFVDVHTCFIPGEFYVLLSYLNPSNLHVEHTIFSWQSHLREFWKILPTSIRRIVMYGITLEYSYSDDLENDNGTGTGPQSPSHLFEFDLLDNFTVSSCMNTWEPGLTTPLYSSFTVNQFYLNFAGMKRAWLDRYGAFLERFIRQIGSGVNKLMVSLNEPSFNRGAFKLIQRVDLSNFTRITSIAIGIIELGDKADDLTQVVKGMWHVLQSIPRARLEEVELQFTARAQNDLELDRLLQNFQWRKTVERLRARFPMLKKIKFRIGTTSWMHAEVTTEWFRMELQELGEGIELEPIFWWSFKVRPYDSDAKPS